MKSHSKNSDFNDSNNIGTLQKRLKPKYKSAFALNSHLAENECKFVINWLKSEITFAKKKKRKKKLNYLYHFDINSVIYLRTCCTAVEIVSLSGQNICCWSMG